MALKKQYSNNKKECKITFTLPQEIMSNFSKVSLVGDFNNWHPDVNVFTENQADGSYSVEVILPSEHDYQFRYLCDVVQWFNEPEADKQVDTYVAGSKNSVITL